MLHESSEALPSVATSTTRVVSFGYDRQLNGLRSRVLRMAGYEVEETFTMAEATELSQSDLIDALVICHTVPNEEREQLVGAVRRTRKLMPILCVHTHKYDAMIASSVAVENSPIAMLDALKAAIRAYKSPKASRILSAS
jgi:DNA-binding NtrC family response regulator